MLAAARRGGALRKIAWAAVAPGNVKVFFRGMLRSFLHICRKRQRASLDESRTIDIHVILREFRAHGGVQRRLARRRGFSFSAWLALPIRLSLRNSRQQQTESCDLEQRNAPAPDR